MSWFKELFKSKQQKEADSFREANQKLVDTTIKSYSNLLMLDTNRYLHKDIPTVFEKFGALEDTFIIDSVLPVEEDMSDIYKIVKYCIVKMIAKVMSNIEIHMDTTSHNYDARVNISLTSQVISEIKNIDEEFYNITGILDFKEYTKSRFFKDTTVTMPQIISHIGKPWKIHQKILDIYVFDDGEVIQTKDILSPTYQCDGNQSAIHFIFKGDFNSTNTYEDIVTKIVEYFVHTDTKKRDSELANVDTDIYSGLLTSNNILDVLRYNSSWDMPIHVGVDLELLGVLPMSEIHDNLMAHLEIAHYLKHKEVADAQMVQDREILDIELNDSELLYRYERMQQMYKSSEVTKYEK